MRFISEHRASAILFHFILSNDSKKRKWIIPVNLCHFVPATILKTGAKIEILDVSEHDYCLDQEATLKRIQTDPEKYSGIIYVRSFGIENDPSDFFSKLKKVQPDLLIIDDKCLGKPDLNNELEPNVDLELYSTGYSKYIDLDFRGYGKLKEDLSYEIHPIVYDSPDEEKFSAYFRKLIYDGGEIISEALSVVVQSNWLESKEIEIKRYFDLVQERITKIELHKAKINNIYNEIIPDHLKLGEEFNHWRFNLKISNRDGLLDKLSEAGLFAGKHYYPLSKLFVAEETPFWNEVHSQIINLFNDRRYTVEQAEQTANIIVDWNSR